MVRLTAECRRRHGRGHHLPALPTATKNVLLGDDGLFAGLRADGTWIEMSTNRTADIAELADAAAKHGIGTLEAPVTGGVHRATIGEITVLAGGEEALFELHKPALAAMGNPVIRVGDLGKASSMKVITNMLAFLHLLGAGEAMMLAQQAGIDLATAFHCIRESSGNSFVHETESQVILSGSYNIGFTLELACKDIGLTAELAEQTGTPFIVGEFVAKLFEEAREKYGGDAWSPRVVQLLEDAVGTQLRAEGFPEELEPS